MGHQPRGISVGVSRADEAELPLSRLEPPACIPIRRLRTTAERWGPTARTASLDVFSAPVRLPRFRHCFAKTSPLTHIVVAGSRAGLHSSASVLY